MILYLAFPLTRLSRLHFCDYHLHLSHAICIPCIRMLFYKFLLSSFSWNLLYFNFCPPLPWMKWRCGQLIAKTGISGATPKTLFWQFTGRDRQGGEEGGALLARRLAGYLFTVWEDEVSIAGPRGSDERNVSPKRNRYLQIEYPPSVVSPFFSWCYPSAASPSAKMAFLFFRYRTSDIF